MHNPLSYLHNRRVQIQKCMVWTYNKTLAHAGRLRASSFRSIVENHGPRNQNRKRTHLCPNNRLELWENHSVTENHQKLAILAILMCPSKENCSMFIHQKQYLYMFNILQIHVFSMLQFFYITQAFLYIVYTFFNLWFVCRRGQCVAGSG